jgi:hypothetical protein
MAEVHGAKGRIEIFEDFTGPEWIIAETAASGAIGAFRIVGQGVADTDAGVLISETLLNGVATMTSPNATDNDSVGLVTGTMFDVALMGTIVAECRVQFADLDTKEFFFGFSDLNTDVHSMEGVLIHGASTTVTLTASDLVGFLLSSELTDDEDWHMVYNGGTTTGETTSTSIDADDDAVAGEWQILRLEIAPNGTARWYIDGVLKQTQAGAVSTTTNLAMNCMLEIKGTGSNETADVDYIYVSANRDWTV